MSRISIVIPCYNYGHYLAATLDSVIAQQDPDWEAIVVDDGSTDHTARLAGDYAAAYPGQILSLAQPNAGPGAARNRGARAASGDWLLFVDADDRLLPGALARYRRALQDHPSAALIVSGARTQRGGQLGAAREAGPVSATRVHNFAAFVRGELCPFNGGAILVERRVVARLRYPEGIRSSEDFVFFAQALSLFDCARAPGAAVALYRHSDSLRYNPSALDGARERMIELLFAADVLPDAARHYRREITANWYLVVARALYRHRRYIESVDYYRRAIRLHPRHLLRTGHLREFIAGAWHAARGR